MEKSDYFSSDPSNLIPVSTCLSLNTPKAKDVVGKDVEIPGYFEIQISRLIAFEISRFFRFES
jgi:hypothetical protein